jgi:DNA-binding MarR family transcriptional regulator
VAGSKKKVPADDFADDPDSRVTYVLWQAQRCSERILVEALQPLGITLSQFGLLHHLRLEPGLTGAELARRLNVTPQSVSVAVAEAKKAGWLLSGAHVMHRNVVELAITKVGSDVLRKALARVHEAEKRITKTLTAAERNQLLRLLLRLRKSARESAP